MDDQVQGEQPSLPLDKLTSFYIKMRVKRTQMKKEWEAEDQIIAEQMNVIEATMLDKCKEMNADSIKTKNGTIIRSVKSRYWTNDWDSMYQFIREHDAYGLLEKRIQQTNMKEFLQENPNVLPAGLNVESNYSVVVRRSKEI